MKNILKKELCCGCSSCYNACPKEAITMIEDDKGFLYPNINQNLCIDCKICQKVCPVLNTAVNTYQNQAYACINNNLNIRMNSSSGGIFYLLAKEILSRNGVVFGAAFNDNFEVSHVMIDNDKDIYKLMGSKYVQSKLNDIFYKVKQQLDLQKYVLFTGTPCQIEGLKSFLKRNYEKLYTQDIICHGVPSPLVWKKYIEYRKNVDKNPPIDISFRNKDNGWKNFNMKFLYKENFYKKNMQDDLYMTAFLKNTSLRDSCYNCKFKNNNISSDITLGDYWGIEYVHSDMFDDKGTSLVIINSSKGEELFNLISTKIQYKRTILNEAIKYNSAYSMPVKVDKKRKKFFKYINEKSFDKLVKQYSSNSDNIVDTIKRYILKLLKVFHIR